MATRRMLAASISVSEQVAALGDDFARLLFTWMIAHADDWGVMPGSPAKVRAIVVPMLDVSVGQVDAGLADMEARGLIWRYDHEGTRYVQFRTWEQYQDLHKRTNPRQPRYCDVQLGTSGNFREAPGSSRLARAPGTEQNRTEQKRERGEATADAAPGSPSLSHASQTEAEAEPEAYSAPPVATVTQESAVEGHPLYAACVRAIGHSPRSGKKRQMWRGGLDELARLGMTPEDVPKLVRAYRTKYGPTIPCHPQAIADNFDELGVSPYVATAHATAGRPAQGDPDPAEVARRREAIFAAHGIAHPPNWRGYPDSSATGTGTAGSANGVVPRATGPERGPPRG